MVRFFRSRGPGGGGGGDDQCGGNVDDADVLVMVTRSSVSTQLAALTNRSDTLLQVESTSGFRAKDVIEFVPSLLAKPLDGPFESALVLAVRPDDCILIVDRWSSNPGFYSPRTLVRTVAHVR